MTKQLKADLALLFVTVGWGASFLLTKNSINKLQVYNFLAIRFFVAFIFSAIIFRKNMLKLDKRTIKYGFLVGTLLFSSYAFQTVGLKYTTISKSAFITGFNVVLVPIMLVIATKKALRLKQGLCVLLAFIGLALLTLNSTISGINLGDFLTLLCAITAALHIILSGKYTLTVDSIGFAIVQIGVVGVWSLLASLLLETPTIRISPIIWINIVTLSIICTSVAFIIQMLAQNYTTPTHTALIYTAEPVFATIFSYIFMGEILGIKGTIGAIMILAGMIISEVNFKK